MIRLERVEDVIKFTFNDNPLYLNNGTIEVPVNSLSLLIDESNIATFKKGNNDAFLSCSLDELGMTKEQLITWYKDNMVDEGITPEEVEDIVESATTNLFGYAEYDSNSQRINFKHDSSGSVISSIDASDFIIDGMVSNVEIVTISDVKYLKITFNTDSGKEPILIPLADIFNPDLYYTKSEIDEALSEIDETLSGKVDSDVFDEKERVISIALNDLDENKLDVSAYTPTDLSNYYTKSETSGATEISTALDGLMITVTGELNNKLGYDDITTSITSSSTNTQVPSAKAVNDLLDTKQNTLVSGTNIKTINNESILGSGNIDIQGGGKAISAGRGILITTGETADTVSFNLPISAGTGTNSLILGYTSSDSYWRSQANGNNSIASGVRCFANADNSIAVGYNNTASGAGSNSNFAQGYMTTASGNRCHSEGLGTSSTADASHSEGHNTTASGNYSHSEGEEVKATNVAEHSQGRYNVSNKANNTWGDSGNTLFSVGNGTADNARHNAFEIRQNGDIYCSDGTNDVKLQDTITATAANTTALGGLSLVKLSQAEYDALVTKDSQTLYIITD